MDISSVAGTGTAAAVTDKAKEGLAGNFDNFLALLTKQLQYQDPLSPLDTNQFTQQLVQFTGVEQAIATNTKLDALIGLQNASQATTAISYLGTTVDAETKNFALTDGEGSFVYALGENAARSAVVILDSTGKPVRSATGETKAGKHTFEWDGEDNDGGTLPDGVYSVEVAAFDADGKAIGVATGASGRVTGVQIVDGEIVLSLGELQVPFSQVYAVRASEEDDA